MAMSNVLHVIASNDFEWDVPWNIKNNNDDDLIKNHF